MVIERRKHEMKKGGCLCFFDGSKFMRPNITQPGVITTYQAIAKQRFLLETPKNTKMKTFPFIDDPIQ